MKNYFQVLPLLFLAACSSYQDHFECVAGTGVGCKSVSLVDQMVNEGKLPLEESCKECELSLSSHVEKGPCTKIWVAPYEDEAGNIHSESYIYVKSMQNAPLPLRGRQ